MTMAVRVHKKRKGGDEATGARRPVTPARRVAFAVLSRVEEEGAFASVLLTHATEALRSDDRALCYELVLGTLRWQLWLDRFIAHYAGRVVAEIDAPVRRGLGVGLFALPCLSPGAAAAARERA